MVKPTNSPSSTTISTTAKTIPVSVTVSRTLSWKRLRRASGGISHPYSSNAAQYDLEHGLNPQLQRAPVDPPVVAFGDLQRNDPMDRRPQGLRHQFRIAKLRQ